MKTITQTQQVSFRRGFRSPSRVPLVPERVRPSTSTFARAWYPELWLSVSDPETKFESNDLWSYMRLHSVR